MLKNCQRTFDRVRKELAYAYDRTTFFPEHLKESQLSLADIQTVDDFVRICPTEKKHYRKGFPSRVLASGFTLNDPRLYRSQSSGSTGERLMTLELPIVYTQRTLECLTANHQFLQLFQQNPRRHVRYAAPNCSAVACADSSTGALRERILSDGTLVLSVKHDLMITPADLLVSNIMEIEQYKPQLYYVDPTHLAFLARFMVRNGFKPYAAPIVTTYSLSTKTSRRLIAEAFGEANTIIDVVSMSELGWLGIECPFGRMHLNNLSYYVELLSDNQTPIRAQRGELYVTSLDNGCTPKIRYRTGDVFQLLDVKCECGHDFPVVRMEGRLCDCIFANGKVLLTPRDVDDLIGAPSWLDFYKLHQLDESILLFTYVVNETYSSGDEFDVIEKIQGALDKEMVLRVQNSEYIPCESSGKFASCSSNLGRANTLNGFRL